MQNRIIDELVAAAQLRKSIGSKKDALKEADDSTLGASRRVAEQFVAAHPIVCLGLAVTAGIALGWWIKRR